MSETYSPENNSFRFSDKTKNRRAFLKGALTALAGAALGGVIDRLGLTKPVTQEKTSSVSKIEQPTSSVQEVKPPKENIKFPPQEYLGIRCDKAVLMEDAKDLGASYVRIDGGRSEVNPTTRVLTYEGKQQALESAKKQGLKVLYQYNPQRLISREEIKDNLVDVIKNYTVSVELGNEPDDTNAPYWNNQDLATFTRFAARAIRVISTIDQKVSSQIHQEYHTKIVIGALINQDNSEKLLTELKSQLDYLKNTENFTYDLGNLTFAIHAYHAKEEVISRAEIFRSTLIKVFGEDGAKANMMFTEIGINHSNKPTSTLVEMYTLARKYSKNQPVFIHELADYEDSNKGKGEEKYGLMDGSSQRRFTYFEEFGRSVEIAETALKANKQ